MNLPSLSEQDLERLADLLAQRLGGSVAPAGTVPAVTPMPIGLAIAELLAVKKRQGLRPVYLKGLRCYLAVFARGREDRPVHEFTVEDLERWFEDRSEPPMAKASNIGRLGSLFSYCVRRRYCAESPVDRLEKPRIDHKPPQILTPEQTERVLRFCEDVKPCALAHTVLTLFCAVRPGETAGISWSDIDFENRTIRIDAAASKVRRRRMIDLHPTAVEWLRSAKDKCSTLPVSRTTSRRYAWCWSMALEWPKWPQDILRHTCGTYLVALHKDAGKVAYMMGNSPRILLTNYANLVTPQECERFWKIRPATKAPELKVVAA